MKDALITGFEYIDGQQVAVRDIYSRLQRVLADRCPRGRRSLFLVRQWDEAMKKWRNEK
jgi:hypothetical protein